MSRVEQPSMKPASTMKVTEPATPSPPLVGLPEGPLTSAEQLDAWQRAKAKADERVQLGLKLFKAVEAQTNQNRAVLKSIGQEHEKLENQYQQDRQRLQQEARAAEERLKVAMRKQQEKIRDDIAEDVAKSLQAYDQWVGKMDEGFTHRIRSIESKLDQLQSRWGQTEAKIDEMMRRAEALLDQSRYLLEPDDAAQWEGIETDGQDQPEANVDEADEQVDASSDADATPIDIDAIGEDEQIVASISAPPMNELDQADDVVDDNADGQASADGGDAMIDAGEKRDATIFNAGIKAPPPASGKPNSDPDAIGADDIRDHEVRRRIMAERLRSALEAEGSSEQSDAFYQRVLQRMRGKQGEEEPKPEQDQE